MSPMDSKGNFFRGPQAPHLLKVVHYLEGTVRRLRHTNAKTTCIEGSMKLFEWKQNTLGYTVTTFKYVGGRPRQSLAEVV